MMKEVETMKIAQKTSGKQTAGEERLLTMKERAKKAVVSPISSPKSE